MAGHGCPVCWTSLPGFAPQFLCRGETPFSRLPKIAERYLPSQAERGLPAPRTSAAGGRTVSRAWGSGLGARAWLLGSLGQCQPHGGGLSSPRLSPFTASSSTAFPSPRGEGHCG